MTINLTILILIAIQFTGFPQAHSRGGDFGGGGSMAAMREDFALKPRAKSTLKNQHSLDSAFTVWMNSLDPDKRDLIIEKVFRHHIVPQFKNRRTGRNDFNDDFFEIERHP